MRRWPRALMGAFVMLAVLGGCKPKVTSLGIWRPDAGERDSGREPIDGSIDEPDAGRALQQYIEAESGELSGGFTTASDASASASRYLSAPNGVSSDSEPGAARARYTFEISRAATYEIWGQFAGRTQSTIDFGFRSMVVIGTTGD